MLTLIKNTEFLDTASGGWHNTTSWGFGTTQIITQADDGTLSGVPNALNSFFSSSSSSIGIFPNDMQRGISNQMLLFFLKVPTTSVATSATAATYTSMSIAFNT
jgi:hypothetical protein